MLENVGEMVQELLKRLKALGANIWMKVLNPNDLVIEKRMFHWALIKSIKPMVHSQTTMTRVETMVLYEVFVKERAIEFAWMVTENIDQTIKVLTRRKYDVRERMRKEGDLVHVEELPLQCEDIQDNKVWIRFLTIH